MASTGTEVLFGAARGLSRAFERAVIFVYRHRYTVGFVAWSGTTYALSRSFLYEFSAADGNSMYPTIPDTLTHLWVNKTYRRGRGVQVGDVVVFSSPLFPGVQLNKRIIAMPGDIVIRSHDRHPTPGDLPLCGITDWKKRLAAQRAMNEFGTIDAKTLSGNPKDEEEEEHCPEPQMIQIPEGHVWVEGDNLAHSRDSRFFGPVPMALISGRTGYFRSNPLQWPESLHAGAGFKKVPDAEVASVLGGDGPG